MLLEGQQCGSHYRLMKLLKQGGMGEVYLAEDTRLHRQVAIKVIYTDFAHAPDPGGAREAAHLFLREARAIGQLDHNHILPLYDSGEDIIDNTKIMYMVMPLRQEGSFGDWLRAHTGKEVLPVPAVERVVRQAAEALQHAHDRQIIHKDVKPSNFLVHGHAEHFSQLNLQLADFGVAKVMLLTSSDSQVIRGTPSYMASEQWEGHPVFATDQYALAVMAYELLTGRQPFEGKEYQRLWHQHNYERPAPPSSINPKIPREIDEVVLRALAKDPKGRFPSVSSFAHAFQRAVFNSGNVQHTVKVSTFEARVGTSRVLTLPDGRQVTVPVPAGAYQGQIIRLEGYGYPTTYDGPRGALILTIAIQEEVAPPFERYIEPTMPVFLPPDNEIPAEPVLLPARRRPVQNGKTLKVAMLLSCLLIITGSLCAFTYTRYNANIISNNQEVATVTASAKTATAATATADTGTADTGTAVASTATAQVQATVDVVQQNPLPAYFSGNGQLGLYDPLTDNSKGYQWLPTTPPALPAQNGDCAFKGGALDASVNGDENYTVLFHPCLEGTTDFRDFAYEVNMIINKGDCGGVTFRAGDVEGLYYYVICSDGRYRLVRYMHDPGTNVTPTPGLNPVLINSTSQLINMNGQSNTIAVEAKGSHIDLYVNRMKIDSADDPGYSTGKVGVIAKSWHLNDPTDVVFTNARVWTLTP